jgi:lysozyme family protein
MAATSYDEALRRVLTHEGGYSNHPSDPGGPTNFGITIHDYRKYVKPNATAADVRAMPLAEAKAIYRSKYWNAMRCDELPAGIDYAVFDYGVNSGLQRAGKVLRRVLKLPDDSHVVSDAVLSAARRKDPVKVIEAICDERLAFLKRLKTWPVFGKGWGPRVKEVRTAAVAMAERRTQATDLAPAVPGKAEVPVPRMARNATAGGVVIAGAAAAQQVHAAGAGAVTVAGILAFALAAAALTWLAFRAWQKRRQAAPARTGE